MSYFDHQPERPAWTCVECGEAWPCADRRSTMMLAPWNAVMRGMAMARLYPLALADHPAEQAGDVWRRFFLWIR